VGEQVPQGFEELGLRGRGEVVAGFLLGEDLLGVGFALFAKLVLLLGALAMPLSVSLWPVLFIVPFAHYSSVIMQDSSVSKTRPESVTTHPFFSPRLSQPSSPVNLTAPPYILHTLLTETWANIAELARQPTQLEAHPRIIAVFERTCCENGLSTTDTRKLTSPQSSPFHSTSASTSLPPTRIQDHFAGVTFPTTPAVAINLLGKHLTNNEVSEILSHKIIYYLGIKADKIQGDLALPNYGYDDERCDYRIVPSDHLNYRYEILNIIGKGGFGRVIRCFDHKEGETVAVKIIRNVRSYNKQAQVELHVLQLIKDWKVPFVAKLLDSFKFRSHECMAFELLDISLYDYLKLNHFRGFPMLWVRTITHQLISALVELQRCGVLHCDLKPENVLFQDKRMGSVRIIDFGSACMGQDRMYSYIQSRFYRAPEVILGIRYSFPVDMWSVGCLIAELYTGRPIFPGENEADQLMWIMSALGPPPSALLSQASKRSVFYNPDGSLKIPANSQGIKRLPGSTSLANLIPSSDEAMLGFISSKC
jgi:hypothetical protein